MSNQFTCEFLSDIKMNGCLSCKGTISIFEESVYDTRFGVDGHFGIYKCMSCGLVQINSRYLPPDLKDFYEKYYNFGGRKMGLYKKLRARFFSSSLYNLWMLFDGDLCFYTFRGEGLLLDVGCNEGRGLKFYQKNGFEVEGLELNKRAAIEAIKSGFSIYTDLLEEFHPKELYDVVVLSNVLEHALNPKEMLHHISRILKCGGQVWISCPNVCSWQRGLFKKYWINWHVPFHICHFSDQALKRILYESGFQVQKIRQKSTALSTVYSIIAYLFAKHGKPTRQLRNPFLVATLLFSIRTLFSPILWLGNKLGRGDCLVVVARKVFKQCAY